MNTPRALLAVALVLTACASSDPSSATPSTSASPSASAAVGDDFIAPPFTAEQIRAGLPVGTVLRLRIAKQGEPVTIEEWSFTAADDKGCTIHTIVFADDGSTQIEDQGSATSTWTELESHAHFPAALTTRTDGHIDMKAGTFDTWHFEVRSPEPNGPVKRMHFAKNLPGPPVVMEIVQGDTVLLDMQLVSRK